MADPVSALLIAGTTATVGGTYMSYKASKKAGKQQQEAQEFNAKVSERNAKVSRLSAQIKKRQTEQDLVDFDKGFNRLQRSTAQAYRVNGFRADTGTPLTVMLDNAYEGEKEKAMIKYNSQIAQAQLEENAVQGGMQADLSRMYGQQARTSGKYNAYSSLLGGASTLAGMGTTYAMIR